MSNAFYAEHQIWPQISAWRDKELVMFAVNWTDRPDMVIHQRHPECDREDPHEMNGCGRFREENHETTK